MRAALLAAAEVLINHRWAELIKDCVQGGKLNRFWAWSLISREGFQEDETDSLAGVPSNNSFSFGVKGNFNKSGRFHFYILVRKSEVCFSDKFQIFYFEIFPHTLLLLLHFCFHPAAPADLHLFSFHVFCSPMFPVAFIFCPTAPPPLAGGLVTGAHSTQPTIQSHSETFKSIWAEVGGVFPPPPPPPPRLTCPLSTPHADWLGWEACVKMLGGCDGHNNFLGITWRWK